MSSNYLSFQKWLLALMLILAVIIFMVLLIRKQKISVLAFLIMLLSTILLLMTVIFASGYYDPETHIPWYKSVKECEIDDFEYIGRRHDQIHCNHHQGLEDIANLILGKRRGPVYLDWEQDCSKPKERKEDRYRTLELLQFLAFLAAIIAIIALFIFAFRKYQSRDSRAVHCDAEITRTVPEECSSSFSECRFSRSASCDDSCSINHWRRSSSNRRTSGSSKSKKKRRRSKSKRKIKCGLQCPEGFQLKMRKKEKKSKCGRQCPEGYQLKERVTIKMKK